MTLKEFNRSATNKTAQLEAQGGKVMRMAHVVRMPDGSECSVDTFGRCDWVTKRNGAVNESPFVWVAAELAPKTGEQILANVGLPWPVMACWNAHDSQWSYANLQINMMEGEYNDPYFETESAHNYVLKGWMPTPDQNPYETKEAQP